MRLNADVETRRAVFFSGIDNQHSYLVLLRELEIVVCLQALDVICQFRDGNRRVTRHACQARKWEKEAISIYVAAHPLVQRFSAEALLSGLSIVGGGSKWKCLVIFFFVSTPFLSRQTRKRDDERVVKSH